MPVPKDVPPPKAQPMPLAAAIAAVPSNVDALIAHVQRLFATPQGTDATLAFTGYVAGFGASGLEALTAPAIQRSAEKLLELASTLPPSTTLLFNSRVFPSPSAALLLLLAKRLRALSTLIPPSK